MSLIYTHPSGGKLYQAGKDELPNLLRNKNISLLILAAEEYQPDYIHGTNGGFLNAEVIYIPLQDTVFFSKGEFQKTVKSADKVATYAAQKLASGKNVISSCKAGLNRSGLISGLAINKLTSQSGKNIANSIRQKRSLFALSNPLFANVINNL